MRCHPICSRQDTDTTFPLVGSISQVPLQLSYLVDLDILPLWFNEQNIGMKAMINLFARGAMIAGISCVDFCCETVECFCKLESHVLLSDPFIPPKEVAVNNLLIFDCPL